MWPIGWWHSGWSRADEVIPNGIEIQRPPVGALGEDFVALARHDVNKNLPALFRIAQLQRQWPRAGNLANHRPRQPSTSLVQQLHRDLPRPSKLC